MSQIRYFSAFIISSLTFVLLYFGFLSLPKVEKKLKSAPSKVIKIALVTPVKKIVKPPVSPIVKATPIPIVKKVEKKKPKKPVIIKKPKPKKIVKKKVIKKKIVKKKVIKKKIIKKKIIKKKKPKKVIKKRIVKKKKIIKKKTVPKKTVHKKRVIPEPIEEYIPIAPPVYHPAPPVYVAPKPVAKPVLKPTTVAPTQTVVKNNYHKKAFLRNVRSKIIANKKYPKIAKRRHVEGSVKVRFDITKQGQVSNIRFINGKRIFQKSIRKTLERTFPMGIPAEVKGELPISDISVVLHFNIH